MTRDVDLSMADEEIKAYVRNWLLLRDDGHNIGWKAFSELCCEDIPSFDVAHQALKGALSERIKRL